MWFFYLTETGDHAMSPMPKDLKDLEKRIKELEAENNSLKEAEPNLLMTELWLNNIFNSLEEAVFVLTPDRRIRNVNDAVLRMWGYSREEVANHSTEVFHVDQDHYEKFGRIIRTIFERGEPASFEFQAKKKNGEIFPTEHTVTPISDEKGEQIGIVSVIRDITKRKEADRILKETDAFLQNLLNAIPTPVFYKDRDGRYLGFNRAFEIFFGEKSERLIGKSVFDISPPELAEKYHKKDVDLFKGGGTQQYESQVKNAKGELRDVIFHKAVFEDNRGIVNGLIGTILDITDRKRTEGELLAERDKLREAVSEIKTLSELLPICANCKKIRDDEGYWNRIEAYIGRHLNAKFTHSICPECIEKLYPGLEMPEE